MATLLLRLAAPLQSWGADSKFEVRQTSRDPSKSGVTGLLAAALGCRRDELPEQLKALRMTVRVDQEGSLLDDFHTAQGIEHDAMGRIKLNADGTLKHDKKLKFVTHRQYLSDAVFVVALECEDADYLRELADALKHPVFPLFLGRRSCPLTLPLVLGVDERDAFDALADCPWQASERYRQRHAGNANEAALRIVYDAQPGNVRPNRRDVPLSFNPNRRRYGMRAVTQDIMAIKMQGECTEHDAMSELP